jgi:hypothetical protein
MGTLKQSELVDEVRSFHAGRDDLTDAIITRALNLVQQQMARRHDFEELRSTEEYTPTFMDDPSVDRFIGYSMLSTFVNPREIYSLRVIDTSNTEGDKLEYVAPRQLDELVPNPAELLITGMPHHYTQWAEKFELFQVPDQAYKYVIRGSIWPTALSTASPLATSSFREKDDIIINLTVSYLYNRLGEYEKAGRFFGIGSTLFQEAVGEDLTRPDREIKPNSERHIAASREYWLDPFTRSVR